MKRRFKAAPYWVTFLLFLAMWGLTIFHLSVLAPRISEGGAESQYFPKAKWGMHHLFVQGSDSAIGGEIAKHFGKIMKDEEALLFEKFESYFPMGWMQTLFTLGAGRYFWGIEQLLEPWMVEQMSGIAHGADPKWNSHLDPVTRQLALHGLHEVGQFFVDSGLVDGGCTAFVIPEFGVGRNFDFEGGEIFDREKSLLWIEPKGKLKYLSIIWPGMVGAVTGINEAGLWVSLNAAGSLAWARHGLPSTLLVAKILREARSADEAVNMIEKAQVLITDIYVVMDATGEAWRVEKSPSLTAKEKIVSPEVITNHLSAKVFEDDPINATRIREQTTLARWKRGKQLLDRWQNSGGDLYRDAEVLLSYLRDKGVDAQGAELPLGHRSAIDSLIATHGVIYDRKREIIYVSAGPHLLGEWKAWDLKQSWALHSPVSSVDLPEDLKFDTNQEQDAVQSLLLKRKAQEKWIAKILKHGCDILKGSNLEVISDNQRTHYYDQILNACLEFNSGQKDAAAQSLEKALAGEPAFLRERQWIELRLANGREETR